MPGSPLRLREALQVLLRRLAVLGATLVLAQAGLFLAVTGGSISERSDGLLAFLQRILTLDLGAASVVSPAWQAVNGYPITVSTRSVAGLIDARLVTWVWLLGATALVTAAIAIPLGVVVARQRGPGSLPTHTAVGHLVRLLPVFFIADIVVVLLSYSRRLFNIDWDTLLVDSPPVLTGLQSMPDLSTPTGFLIASKWVIVPALAASTALVPTMIRVVRSAAAQARSSAMVAEDRARGITSEATGRRAVAVWVLENLPGLVAVLQVAALVAETAAGNLMGLSTLLGAAYVAGDIRLLAGILLVLALPIVVADLVRVFGVWHLTGSRRRDIETLDRLSFPERRPALDRFRAALPSRHRLSWHRQRAAGLRGVIRTAGPAGVVWSVAGLLLLALQLGAVFDAITGFVPGVALPRLPTLVSWATIPDADYLSPEGHWIGGFLGLSPAASWAVRLLVAEVYLLAVLAWVWAGVRIWRVFVRDVDEPLLGGPVRGVLRREWRVSLGLGVVCLVLAAGLFAPATAPSMADDPTKPYDDQYVSFVDDGEVDRILRLGTVMPVQPDSSAEGTPGPFEYDAYDRFHPFGTIWILNARPMDGEVTYNRDLFAWWAYEIKSLLPYLAVIGGFTLVGALTIVALGRLGPLDEAGALVADAVGLLPLIPLVLVVREFLASGAGGQTVGIPSPVPAGSGTGPPPARSLQYVVLGLLGALLVGRAVRRVAADGSGIRGRLRRAVGPAAGYAALTTAGMMVYVLVVRLFYRNKISTESPGPNLPAIDPRAALNFTWIDTALWYTHTVPLIATVGFLAALAVLGDGIRRATAHRADPEGDGATEPVEGGGGT